jgi:uncharacterized protein YecE (DUF72 family)
MPDKHLASCRIGTSGYQYDHWRSVFYPEVLPKKRRFEHYAVYAYFNNDAEGHAVEDARSLRRYVLGE